MVAVGHMGIVAGVVVALLSAVLSVNEVAL